jgi:hypothetical protein
MSGFYVLERRFSKPWHVACWSLIDALNILNSLLHDKKFKRHPAELIDNDMCDFVDRFTSHDT